MNNRINTKKLLFLIGSFALCFIQQGLLAQENWVGFIDLQPEIHSGGNVTADAPTHHIYVMDEKFGTEEWEAIDKTLDVQK